MYESGCLMMFSSVADLDVAGPGDVMDASHKGPTLAYLKKVTDATKDSGVGNGW